MFVLNRILSARKTLVLCSCLTSFRSLIRLQSAFAFTSLKPLRYTSSYRTPQLLLSTSRRSSSSATRPPKNKAEMAPPTFPRFADVSDLHPLLKKNVATMGFENMTEIQAKTWEAGSSGQDVLGRARTGTGKTVSFLLPAIQQLLDKSKGGRLPKNTIHMLVLSPTRELAAQIDVEAQSLTNHSQPLLSHQVVFGGASKPKDIKSFERRVPTILVATPGRLRDHLQTTNVKGSSFASLLKGCSVLVLDETDRLLDMGFRREVEDIISYLPAKQNRQTLLFSATVPPEVKAVMGQVMKSNFVTVDCIHDTDPASHTNAQVQQTHCILKSDSRLITGTVDVLQAIIANSAKNNDVLKMVVFFNTAHLVAYYAALFTELGVKVLELHSRKSQAYRTRTADAFRNADRAILFTSDVSARGVDYPGVTNVVQFGIADSRESYIHRLGRTGRAGRVGEGLLVLSDLETKFLQKLKGLDIPNNAEMQNVLDGPVVTQVLGNLLEGTSSSENLESNAKAAYRSMLGFYNGKLSKLGFPGNDSLIGFCNGWSNQAGLTEIPELEMKTVKKMGLAGAQGLNIVKNGSTQQGGGRGGGRGSGRGGGRGGGGRGGGGRGRGSSNNSDQRNGPAKRHMSTDGMNEPKKPKQDGDRPRRRRNGGGRGNRSGAAN